MSNNAAFAIHVTPDAVKALAYPSKALAERLDPKAIIVTGEASLLASAIKGPDLIRLHNAIAEKPVAKFESRIAAVRRVFAGLVQRAPKASVPEDAENPPATTAAQPRGATVTKGPTELAKGAEGPHSKQAAKEAKAAEREAAKGGKKPAKAPSTEPKEAGKSGAPKAGGGIPGGGRASSFTGKKYQANPDLKENPRREGTHGYNSMAILMRAKGPITFETYVERGGRAVDLRWDLDRGHAQEVK